MPDAFHAVPSLLRAEVGPLVVVHDGKIGLAAVEKHLRTGLVVDPQRMLRRSLFPAAMLYLSLIHI